MESKSQKITSILEKLIPLLNLCDFSLANYYKGFFEYTIGELNKPHELHKIAENILLCFGGMNTFNDIVLQKDGKVLIEENREFKALSTDLFIACEEIIAQKR